MNFSFLFTLAIFILLTIVLVREWVPPEISIFSALIILIIAKVVTVKEALSGFSNEGMLTIGLLFVVAGSMQTTGALEKLNVFLFGKKNGSISAKLARISVPVAGVSAFLNNTPIVAMLIPMIKSWTDKNNQPISKFLIPLSYAAILGGMCTLIGTSTNLIVHGLMIENGSSGFNFFELSYVGIPAAAAGLLYIIIFGNKLLPDRKTPFIQLEENTREFVIELKVTPAFNYLGKTIEEAGLRHLKGLYLFQIDRDGISLNPARPQERISLDDRLFFTGLPQTIIELQKTPGLQLIKDPHFDLKNYDSDEIKTYEAVVSPGGSYLIGKNIRESKFRDRYNAVILAIHRNGERIEKKIGDIYLRPGDTLLLLADKGFKDRWYNSTDFYLISNTAEVHSKPKWQSYFSISVFSIMILLAALEIIPIISAMGVAAILLLAAGTISGDKAIYMVDWRVLIVIASSFGIAIALENSGVGGFFANVIIKGLKSTGVFGILAGIYFLTAIYTNFITNNTAAVLMFPIAISAASTLNLDVHPFAVAIAIGASSSFATPISYQTNLMVYGPGGYKFTDFLKFGIPLQIIVGIIAVILTYYIYF